MAPYILNKETPVLTKGEYATTAGHRNWLITNLIIDRWLANPSYATTEEIFEDFFEHPEHNDEILSLTRGSRFSRQDWFRSSKKACLEFERRIVGRYEDYKRKINGHDDPYIRRGALPKDGIPVNFGDKNYGGK